MNPWQYLDDIIRTDRGPEHDEQWMTNRLQLRWPGNYRVERVIDYHWQSVEYVIVFDDAKEETMFILKWGAK
jgi:hypothetical protein